MSRFICIVAIHVALIGKVAAAQADEADDKRLSESIKGAIIMLEKEHLQHTPVDDAISRKWFAKFFEWLDPRKMYFLEEDLREFHVYESRLDDLGRAGDLRFSRLVRERFRQRVKEATEDAKKLIGTEHDFEIDEEAPVDYDYFAVDRAAHQERWRLRIKSELIIERQVKRLLDEVQKQLLDRYCRISRQADEMTDERLHSHFVRSLTRAIDPNCGYYSEEILRTFRGGMLRRLTLGFSFSPDRRRNLISEVLPKFDRLSDAILGNELLAIQSPDGQIYDVVEMPPEEFRFLPLETMNKPEREGDVILHLWNPNTLRRTVISWPVIFAR